MPAFNRRSAMIPGYVGAILVITLGVLSFFSDAAIYPLGLVLLLWPPVWTLIHATANQNPTAPYWTLLALFASVVGLIVYFLAAETRPFRLCQECGKGIQPGFGWCPWCGAKAAE